jgi:proline dehydrogenase
MINKMIAGVLPYLPKKLVWIFSSKYIAGKELDDAIRTTKSLNSQGIKVTIDLLGEFITNLGQATENKEEYLSIIDRVQSENLDSNYSLKPTFFGLLLDPETCYQNIREIVAKAAHYDNFIRVDMEDSPCTDLEISLFRRLKQEFPRNVGLVFQAYLRRTLSDIRNLEDLHSEDVTLNFRICKGIYIEPEAIAFKKYSEINENFLTILEYLFSKGLYPAIATHDKVLVEGVYRLIEKYQVPKNRYEFQMLYGVTPELRKSILEKGHTMRVYVPFGKDWFGYSTRRLKENPSVVRHILKALFYKG